MNMNPKRSELLRSNSLDQRILVLELTQEYLIAAIGVTGEPPFAVMVGDGTVLPKIAKLDLMPNAQISGQLRIISISQGPTPPSRSATKFICSSVGFQSKSISMIRSS